MVDGIELFFKESGGDTHALMNERVVDRLEVYMATHNDSILNYSQNKGIDKEILIQELERVLTSEEFGYRIIE